jgi:3-oxoadipate enol-lactonase
LEANGFSIQYEISEKDHSPVPVLSDSLGAALEMWDPQVDALKAYYQVFRYDTRGHGSTDAPVGIYTLDELAAP